MYQRFLERVVETTEYFHDVPAIQQRLQQLVITRDEVQTDQAAREAESSELKAKIKRLATVRTWLVCRCCVQWGRGVLVG